jgi:hypothetical protein
MGAANGTRSEAGLPVHYKVAAVLASAKVLQVREASLSDSVEALAIHQRWLDHQRAERRRRLSPRQPPALGTAIGCLCQRHPGGHT